MSIAVERRRARKRMSILAPVVLTGLRLHEGDEPAKDSASTPTAVVFLRGADVSAIPQKTADAWVSDGKAVEVDVKHMTGSSAGSQLLILKAVASWERGEAAGLDPEYRRMPLNPFPGGVGAGVLWKPERLFGGSQTASQRVMMSKALKRLAERGLVVRFAGDGSIIQESDTTRRTKRVQLTNAGRAEAKRLG